MPRTSIKGQVLTDLVAKFTEPPTGVKVEEHRLEGKLVQTISPQGLTPWMLYIDGAANYKGFRVGLVIVSLDGITIEKSLRLGFSA